MTIVLEGDFDGRPHAAASDVSYWRVHLDGRALPVVSELLLDPLPDPGVRIRAVVRIYWRQHGHRRVPRRVRRYWNRVMRRARRGRADLASDTT